MTTVQVDEEHRKRLLEELKEVVTYLNGRTDSMIFVLNRVDQRKTDDFPLESRIEKLKTEIQTVLSLPEPPIVIPFSAILLYHAQCAWGTESINGSSSIKPKQRLIHLKGMFEDCAGLIKHKTLENRDLRQWFRNIEDKIDDNQDIDDETMQTIYRHALDWSGGKQLWEQLNLRVQHSFYEIVIVPALIQVLKSFDALASKIDTILEIRQIEKKQEVEIRIEKIKEIEQNLKEVIKKYCEDLTKGIKDRIEEFKENTPKSRKKGTKARINDKIEKFKEFRDIVDKIADDLNQKIIIFVQEALKNKMAVYDLEDGLQAVISPVIAHDIARAYDKVQSKLHEFNSDSGFLVKSVRLDDRQAIKELELAEMAVRKLYKAMKEALSRRACFVLQGKTKELEEALKSLAGKKFDELDSLVKQELVGLNIDRSIYTEFKQRVSVEPPSIPDDFFNFQNTMTQKESSEKRKIGSKK
uniref:Uncharacterized protein n=1 Tax=Desertifilum tharense IPPAS B-1220 TaxID=1781255 RepID=A0ACD5GR17_9CYAN